MHLVTTKSVRLLLAAFLLAGAGAAGADERITYSYDALGRLVGATNSGTANSGLATQIGYDPAGNRSNYTVTGIGALVAAVAGGSFEVPEVGNGYVYAGAAGPEFVGNAGVAGNGSAWGFQPAADGDQTGFLQAYQGGGGRIALDLINLAPGASYRVSFSLAQRTTYGGVATVSAAFGSTPLGSFAPTSGAFTQFTTTAFTPLATSGQIVFSVPATQGDVSSAIDKVTIALSPAGGN